MTGRRAPGKPGTGSVFAVVGAGNGGLAMAGHLGLMGFETRLYNRSDGKLAGVRWNGGIELEGAVEGFGPVALAGSDLGAAIAGAGVVMVATPATAHAELAAAMAPLLADGQIVVLNPGRTGGALEFRKTLADSGCRAKAVVAEAQTFIYASRALTRSRARIYRVKNEVPLAALPSARTPEVLAALAPAFPQFRAGGNVLATSLENIGAIFHPALTILNAGWIEATGGDFDYYLQGVTPSVAKILEAMDDERLAVARVLGVASHSAREWLYLTYDSPGATLHAAVAATAAYAGIKAPASVDHRYLSEDVPMSLVPIAALGAAFGAPTPTIDAIIGLACLLHGRDYRSSGRNVERLGLAGLDLAAVHRFVTDPDAAGASGEGD